MDLVIENVGRRSDDWGEEGAPTDVGEASLNGYERNALYWNRGEGHFVDVGHLTGANRIEDGRGVAVADFDHDGRQDLLIANLHKPAALLMGRGDVGHWLQISLVGAGANPDALAATVTARVGDRLHTRQVAAGSGYLATSSSVLHFGLGDASSIDVLEVRWPSGRVQTLSEVAADQRLQLRESDFVALQAQLREGQPQPAEAP